MSQLRRDFLLSLEAGLAGLFLIQGARFVYATLYARASSADLVRRVANPDTLTGVPGVVQFATVQNEIVALAALLLLPLLALIIGRWAISIPFAVILVALGRSMALQTPDLEVPAASLVVGAGLLYLTLIIIRRPTFFPNILLLGLTADQIIRVLDNTYDRTWQADYRVKFTNSFDMKMGVLVALVCIALILLSIVIWYSERRRVQAERQTEGYAPDLRGQLNVWGGLALGGIFYLEFTLLGLPNAVAHWSGTGYSGIVPWLLAATALPLVPEVRELARQFAGMFDGAWRGWLWMLLIGLLLVVGRRFDGPVAGVALVVTQFLVCLTLWWIIQTGLPRRNVTGINVIIGAAVFAALAVGDYFTYDYAYVRDLADPYQNVSSVLRSFREMGLGLALIAALLLSIPMILARRRIPWRGGRTAYTLLNLLLVLGVSFAGATLASEHIVRRPLNPSCLRVATFNIHGGYSQFFDPNLEKVAQLIELNGVDITLLQEVDTGRLASFGVDQALWLARRLNMEVTFFPQNEVLQGIAVLSRVPIVDTEGLLLPSEGNQAVAMHVELDPERLVSDPVETGYLHVYNAWLGFRLAERDNQPVPEGEQDQNRQMQTLLNWIAAEHAPAWTDRIILGGTFNFGPETPLYNTLRMNQLDNPAIKDPFAGLRVEDAMTVFLIDGTAARYDYLWTFNLPLTGAMVDQSPEAANTSDHRSAIVAISRREGIECPP
jgi:endonuclease/exonuclease/phosphatase family metal-dependent hydrolase